jgi:hypothetical protein
VLHTLMSQVLSRNKAASVWPTQSLPLSTTGWETLELYLCKEGSYWGTVAICAPAENQMLVTKLIAGCFTGSFSICENIFNMLNKLLLNYNWNFCGASPHQGEVLGKIKILSEQSFSLTLLTKLFFLFRYLV